MIYGTAWKQEATAGLVKQAIAAGFRAIDTANQKKHYREDYVGDALLELAKQGIRREDLFLQSKYTYVDGQDHRLPYDPHSDFTTQVKSSFASSLENLHTDYLDSYLLHGPSSGQGLTDDDWEVWAAMEEIQLSGKAKKIGVSNVGIHHLQALWKKAKVKPAFVQNRCFAIYGWDHAVREFCLANQIVYQGFSLLTANVQVLNHPKVWEIARRLKVEPQQVVFRFSEQIGILPITGTTNPQHMKEDLAIDKFELSGDDLKTMAALQ
jgi:diketogulonate reductase-like aldo/keto reductase